MAKHDQRPDKRFMTCAACRDARCHQCIDVLRSSYSNEGICTCGRTDHEVDVDTAIMEQNLAAIQWGADGSPG